jgi:hypothetical protein
VIPQVKKLGINNEMQSGLQQGKELQKRSKDFGFYTMKK